MPKPLSQLFQMFMEINYPSFFNALGFKGQLYDPASNHFEEQEIEEGVEMIIKTWKDKYPYLAWKTSNIRYENINSFNLSFLSEVQALNFDGGK
jgi:hypothetical protein